MSESLEHEFLERKDDLELVIRLLKIFDRVTEFTVEIDDERVDFPVPPKLIEILKSVVFLMSYNQSESTMRGCIEAVYDALADNNIGFEQLKKGIQIEILGNTRKYSGATLHKELNGGTLNESLAAISFVSKDIFSGNVDRMVIKEFEKRYELTIDAPESCSYGSFLQDIKNHRNELAHGHKPFSKQSLNQTPEECTRLSEQTCDFLEATIETFMRYIADQQYLKPTENV